MVSLECPLASVVCITYQHVHFIEQCVQSLVSQETTFDFEVIVRDDASTDGTQEVLERLRAIYHDRLVLILERENTYRDVAPLAAALLAARGEFVAFCEGDDYWLSRDKLARCVSELLDDSDLALVGHVAVVVDADGRPVRDGSGRQDLFGVPRLYRRGEVPQAHTGSLVIRRSVLGRLGELASGVIHEDLLIKCLAAEVGSSLVLADQLSARRVHSGGVWTSASGETQVERSIITVTHLLQNFPRCRGELEVSLAQAVRMQVTGLIRKGRLLRAFSKWWAGFRLLRTWRARRWVLLPRCMVVDRLANSS